MSSQCWYLLIAFILLKPRSSWFFAGWVLFCFFFNWILDIFGFKLWDSGSYLNFPIYVYMDIVSAGGGEGADIFL